MPRTPRIITKTVQRLRKIADVLSVVGGIAVAGKGQLHSAEVREWADELDAYDARETRPDPTKRRRKAKAAKGRR